jgi:hypothetical protein
MANALALTYNTQMKLEFRFTPFQNYGFSSTILMGYLHTGTVERHDRKLDRKCSSEERVSS